MFYNFEFFEVKSRSVAGILIFLAVIFMMTACSTVHSIEKSTENMVRDFKAPDSNLKKKIALTPFENKTSFKDGGMAEKIIENLERSISSSCSNIILEKPGDAGYPDELAALPRGVSGQIDSFDLAEIGRRFGLNGIVTGTIINITPDNKKKGILWFKSTHYYVQVQIAAQVYDTETAAKLLDESFVHEVEVDEADLESIQNQPGIQASITDEAFRAIADKMGEKICNAVVLKPWKGFIKSVDAHRVMINSGEKTGIKIGDRFDVFDSSGILKGAQGQRFFIPGLKVGEIKITKVYPATAEAIVLSGHDIRPGFSIRTKD
jgi:Flagellar assembly protein T, C-terminal domain